MTTSPTIRSSNSREKSSCVGPLRVGVGEAGDDDVEPGVLMLLGPDRDLDARPDAGAVRAQTPTYPPAAHDHVLRYNAHQSH